MARTAGGGRGDDERSLARLARTQEAADGGDCCETYEGDGDVDEGEGRAVWEGGEADAGEAGCQVGSGEHCSVGEEEDEVDVMGMEAREDAEGREKAVVHIKANCEVGGGGDVGLADGDAVDGVCVATQDGEAGVRGGADDGCLAVEPATRSLFFRE